MKTVKLTPKKTRRYKIYDEKSRRWVEGFFAGSWYNNSVYIEKNKNYVYISSTFKNSYFGLENALNIIKVVSKKYPGKWRPIRVK